LYKWWPENEGMQGCGVAAGKMGEINADLKVQGGG